MAGEAVAGETETGQVDKQLLFEQRREGGLDIGKPRHAPERLIAAGILGGGKDGGAEAKMLLHFI